MLTVDMVITSNGRYPERAKSQELTKEVLANMEELVKRVNLALKELGVTKIDISSGFRTSESNSKVGNAAKRSSHMTGQAIDIIDDKEQSLCKKFTKEVLIKFDLYREDSDFTKGKNTNWTHLQIRPTASGNRIFKP